MKTLFAKLAVSVGALVGSAGFAGVAAADPGGSFYFTNNASVAVNRTADSHSSSYTKSFPTQISAAATAYGYAYTPYGSTIYSGTTIWQDPVTGYGCSFTIAISYNNYTGKYTFSFGSSKQGGSSSPATCSITADRNTSSGSFTAYPVIGGF